MNHAFSYNGFSDVLLNSSEIHEMGRVIVGSFINVRVILLNLRKGSGDLQNFTENVLLSLGIFGRLRVRTSVVFKYLPTYLEYLCGNLLWCINVV